MSNTTVIFDDPLVASVHAPRPANTLLVSFNCGGDYKGNTTFPGDRFVSQQGWAGVGILDKGCCWFPKASMAPLLEAVRALIAAHGYRRVITWGAGMGGYGALRFAADIGAETTLAFSPQTSIDPVHTGFPNRAWDAIDPKLREGMLVEPAHLAPRAVIVYDPTAPQERWYGNQLERNYGAQAVLFPLTGRDTLPALAETGQQRAFFDAVLEGDLTTARRLLRLGRRQSALYFLGRVHSLEKRGVRGEALAAAQAGFAVAPLNTRAAGAFTRLAIEAGESQAAVTAALLGSPLITGRRAVHQSGLLLQIAPVAGGTVVLDLLRLADAGGLLVLSPVARATVLIRAGAVNQAMAMVATLPEQPVEDAREWDGLIDALSKAGKAEAAIPLFARRIEFAPRDLPLRLRHVRALAAVGLKVEAKHAAEAADALDNLTIAEMQELMRLHRELGALHRVEQLAKLILGERPELFEVRRELIDNYASRADVESMRTQLDKALLIPQLSVNVLISISAYYMKIADMIEGAADWRRARMTPPPIPDAEMALLSAQKAIELNKDSLLAILTLIESQTRLGRNKDANANIDLVIRNYELTSAEQWVRVAKSMFDNRRPEEAINAALRAERIPQKSVGTRAAIARLLASAGATKKAEEIAISINYREATHIGVLSELYNLYVTLKRDDLASETVRHALSINPYDKVMRERMSLLTLVTSHSQGGKNMPASVGNVTRPKGFFSRLFTRRG